MRESVTELTGLNFMVRVFGTEQCGSVVVCSLYIASFECELVCCEQIYSCISKCEVWFVRLWTGKNVKLGHETATVLRYGWDKGYMK